MGSGLVVLCLKSAVTRKLLTVSRNWWTLRVAVPPWPARPQMSNNQNTDNKNTWVHSKPTSAVTLFTCLSRFQGGDFPCDHSPLTGPVKDIIFSLFRFFLLLGRTWWLLSLLHVRGKSRRLQSIFNCSVDFSSMPNLKYLQ